MPVVAENVVTIRRLTIDTVTWTAVVVPIGCNGLSIKQGDGVNDIKVRTDPSGGSTEDTISNGYAWTLPVSGQNTVARFQAGDTVCYLQAVAGTGPAVITHQR